MKPKFSIIIPVYNVEKYLKRCINSVLNQSFKDIEIILVNDGSTDKSGIICKEYSSKYDNISFICKENGGLSDARNTGMKMAIGEYIIFLDSDDYLDVNACELFDKYCRYNPDIIMANARQIINDRVSCLSHTILDDKYRILNGEEALIHEFNNNTMHMAACMNIYRREFLVQNNLYFKIGIFHEDEHWTPRVFLKAYKVMISDITFYNYIIRKDSITTKKDKSKNAVDIIETCYELSTIYDQLENSELKRTLNDYLVTLFLHAFYIGKFYKSKYKKYINKKFLTNRASSKRNVLKINIFKINVRLYYLINKLIKTQQKYSK